MANIVFDWKIVSTQTPPEHTALPGDRCLAHLHLQQSPLGPDQLCPAEPTELHSSGQDNFHHDMIMSYIM